MGVLKSVDTEDDNRKQVILNCDCGCHQGINITYDADLKYYYIDVVCGAFTERQKGLFRTIRERIKAAWFMLRGKEYRLCDICVTKEQVIELKKAINEITK